MHVVFTIMLTFLFAISVSAQGPDQSDTLTLPIEKTARHSKDSLYGNEIGIYSGYGWNSRGCSQCYQEQWTGGWIVGVNIGVRLSKKFGTAVIIHYWMEGSNLWKPYNFEYRRGSFSIHLAGNYYPFRNPYFFLKGSAGLSIFNFTPSDPVTLDNGAPMFETLSKVGPGFSVGIGRAFRITKKVIISPAIDYLYQPFRQLKGDGPDQVLSGAEGSKNLYISLGIIYHIPADVP